MNIKTNNNNNLINIIIGFSLVAFAIVLALWALKVVAVVAPLIGLIAAIVCGFWYFQADNDTDRLRALRYVVLGLIIIIIF